jgi:hypothetical protein
LALQVAGIELGAGIPVVTRHASARPRRSNTRPPCRLRCRTFSETRGTDRRT